MSRMIDADVLLSQVKRSREKNPYTGAMLGSLNAVYDFTHRDVLNLINSAPTIDVEPVRHGQWRRLAVWSDGVVMECTACQISTFQEEGAITKYCPNCGAKMNLEAKT